MLNKYYEVFSKHLSVVKQFFFSGRGKKIKNQAVPRTDNGTKGNCNYISETFRQKKKRAANAAIQCNDSNTVAQIKYIQLIGSLPSTF